MKKSLKPILVLVSIFTCLSLLITIAWPQNNQALSLNSFPFTEYAADGYDECDKMEDKTSTTVPHHHDNIVISKEGNKNIIDFWGHFSNPYFEFAIANPNEDIENAFFNFTINEETTDWHTLTGSGFFFNAASLGGSAYHAYFVRYESANVSLYEINFRSPLVNYLPSDGTDDPPGDNARYKLIKSISKFNTGIHEISIQATQNHVVYIDNSKILFDEDITPTGGNMFGPAVQWGSHFCSSCSHIQYTDVVCGINAKKPVADFEYNASVSDIRNPVITINHSKDLNTPATSLTYYWTVNKINEDGSKTLLLDKSPTPFTKYNASGIGIYETTLQVQNEYRFFSEEVTKQVEIISVPEINIVADKTEYEPGQKVTFKADKWFNCSSLTNNIDINNVVSPNLYNVELTLPGSDSIEKSSGDIKCDINITYTDKTSLNKTITIPSTGTSFNDSSNKEIASIRVIYKNMPTLSTIKDGQYLIYTFETQNPLSNYYVGGAQKRKYQITNTAIISVVLNNKPVTASSNATTNLIEKYAAFSLKGTVDNKNAITKVPACNTEFMLKGTSYGGENISLFISVKDGISDLVELPYGEYKLNEEDEYTLGYDRIAPITIVLDNRGITVDKTTIANKGAVPFVKPIQITKINVKRIYESAGGMPLNSDTDFTVQLTGTPVIDGIDVNFELTSLKDEPVYKYNNLSELILPIGTFNVKETKSYDMVVLNNITVNNDLSWDAVLNSTATYSNPNSSFSSSKNIESEVVLKYVSNAYFYDESVYENSIIINPILVNANQKEIEQTDIEKVLQNPDEYSYPVWLTNVLTNAKYCGIATADNGAIFSYMIPGKYQIDFNQNMYINLESVKEQNSNKIKFTEENGKYFVEIPEETSEISINETQSLTDWRGYSAISVLKNPLYTDVNTHVAFTLKVATQKDVAVSNAEFEFYDLDNNLLYFIEKDTRLYNTDKGTAGAVSRFKSDKNGEIHFYKFPEGKFYIKQISSEVNPQNEIEKFTVTGNNNVMIKVCQVNPSDFEKPVSLSLSSIKNIINVNETLRLPAKTLPSTAYKNVVYKSSNSDVISVSKDGIITGKLKGSATIFAVSALDDKIVDKIEITVKDPANPDMTALGAKVSNIQLDVGEVYTAGVVYSPSTLLNPTISWESKDANVATVSSTGLITGKSEGVTDIVAKSSDLSTTFRVTVGKVVIAPTGIKLNKSEIQLVCNDINNCEDKLIATVVPDNTTDTSVKFASNHPEIVSVDANGVLTAKSTGSAVITATTSNGISASCVVSSVNVVTNITTNVSDITVVNGNAVQIMATPRPASSINSNQITWKSLDESVATVSNTGLVTTKKVGTTTIIATASYPGIADVTTECKITVVSNLISATNLDVCLDDKFETFAFSDITRIKQGESFEFYARVRPASTTNPEIIWTFDKENIVAIAPADDSTYSSSNPVNKFRLASVGTDGGEVTVTGTVKGTSIRTSFKVVVDSKSTGFKFSQSSPYTLVLGKTNNDTVSISIINNNPFSMAKSIKWNIEDESIVEASHNTGSNKEITLKAKALGSTKISATVEYYWGGEFTEEMEILVESPRIDVLVDGTPVDEIHLNVGETKGFLVEPNYKKDSANSGYSFSSGSFVNIVADSSKNSPNGLYFDATGVTEGTEEITFTPSDTTCPPKTIRIIVGSGIHKSITLTLNKNEETNTIQVVANTENITEPVQFSSLNEEIATIDENGNLTILQTGTVTIKVTAEGITQTIDVDVTVTQSPSPDPDTNP